MPVDQHQWAELGYHTGIGEAYEATQVGDRGFSQYEQSDQSRLASPSLPTVQLRQKISIVLWVSATTVALEGCYLQPTFWSQSYGSRQRLGSCAFCIHSAAAFG